MNYDKTFALVTRLQPIRMLVGLATFIEIKLYQMDVRCAFLNG